MLRRHLPDNICIRLTTPRGAWIPSAARCLYRLLELLLLSPPASPTLASPAQAASPHAWARLIYETTGCGPFP